MMSGRSVLEQVDVHPALEGSWRREAGETQRFWIGLLGNVLGVGNVTENVLFE